jgi:hypothetical protein
VSQKYKGFMPRNHFEGIQRFTDNDAIEPSSNANNDSKSVWCQVLNEFMSNAFATCFQLN